jgi:integrase
MAKDKATRLTDAVITKLKTDKWSMVRYDKPNGSRSDFVSGFGIRVTKLGVKSFVLNYRTKAGTERRYTIGRWPEWTLAAARIEARELKGQIAQGRDPVVEGKALRDSPTIADLVKRFEKEHLPTLRPDTRRDYAGILELIKDAIGSSKVMSLDLAEVQKLHRKITEDRGGYRANRLVGVLSSMYSEAITWKWASANPCVGCRRNVEQERERFLTDGELLRLTAALDAYPNQRLASFFRFLLLSGARAGESRMALWAHLDLEAGLWRKPGSTTKTGRDNTIPLSEPAVELLLKIRSGQDAGELHVFPGDGPNGELVKYADAWDKIRKAAGAPDIRVHDLRHSFASTIASSGFGLPVIGKLLGHRSAATTRRYAHLVGSILKDATEAAGKRLSVVPQKAIVTPMPRRHR